MVVMDVDYPVFEKPNPKKKKKKTTVTFKSGQSKKQIQQMDFETLKELVSKIADPQNQFYLCGKRSSLDTVQGKPVDLLFVSENFTDAIGMRDYVYIWIGSRYVKEFNDKFYRAYCASKPHFIHKKYVDLKEAQCGIPMVKEAPLVTEQTVEMEQIVSSRKEFVRQITQPMTVPGSVDLTKEEILEMLNRDWVQHLSKTDYDYLLSSLDRNEQIQFYEPFLSCKPPTVSNKSVVDTSAIKWLALKFKNESTSDLF